MPTWREEFARLSEEQRREIQRWKEGKRNHDQLRASMDAITFFLNRYQAAGQPDRDTAMPPA